MVKKYEFTGETKIVSGITLHRIKALVSFANIQAGDIGGWIEKESNLSHIGDAWVCGNAKVYDDAEVCGNAKVCDNAMVCGNAWVCGEAVVCDDAMVYGEARVYGKAKVYDDAEVCGNAKVYGEAEVCDNAKVYGEAQEEKFVFNIHEFIERSLEKKDRYINLYLHTDGEVSITVYPLEKEAE